MNKEFYKWNDEIGIGDGVIVGCDQNQEWLLPWWYMNFRMHNEYAITFIDFGDMSNDAKEWCLKKGGLKSLNIPVEKIVVSLEKADPEQAKIWQWRENYDIALARLAWFKKPFACLQSPYKRTIWMDLDCQVRKSITPIFEYCENDFGFAIAEEHHSQREKHETEELIQKGEVEYNSGVFVFKHGITLIPEWAKMGLENSSQLRGDQEALSRMLFNQGVKLPELPTEYNCRYHINDEIDPTIIHWLGRGQQVIEDLTTFLDYKCHMNFSLK